MFFNILCFLFGFPLFVFVSFKVYCFLHSTLCGPFQESGVVWKPLPSNGKRICVIGGAVFAFFEISIVGELSPTALLAQVACRAFSRWSKLLLMASSVCWLSAPTIWADFGNFKTNPTLRGPQFTKPRTLILEWERNRWPWSSFHCSLSASVIWIRLAIISCRKRRTLLCITAMLPSI